jgi:Magnesium chelatase, subunit ChlI C-terminal
MYVLPLIRVALHYPAPTRERNASARRYKSNAIVPAPSSTASTSKSRCRRSPIRASPVATLANRTEIIRQRVNNARNVQLQRFQKRSIHANAQMSARDIKRYCAVNDDAEKLLETAVNKLGLSARA